ncbi:MAG: hypothetical protein Q7T73_06970 [Beijerinckiaceae bacterium]|nr:hypothetical protein [Beijerinckiaceae bacterium]
MLDDTDGARVTLSVVEPDPPETMLSSVIVTGRGFPTSAEAEAEANRWVAWLQLAFATMRIGADLGRRQVPDGWKRGIEADVAGAAATELPKPSGLVADEPGILVFPEEPWPFFSTVKSFGWAGQSADTLAKAVNTVREAGSGLSEVEQTAYELFSSSFSAVSSDARFIVLMMALETLIDPRARDAPVASHVAKMIEMTRGADLPTNEVASLVGSLEYMERESISQAGRRLCARLGSETYSGLAAERFFTKCYSLRSSLVHGAHPRPSTTTVETFAPGLERMVCDLLAGRFRLIGHE